MKNEPPTVSILAIGVKVRNEVHIGGEHIAGTDRYEDNRTERSPLAVGRVCVTSRGRNFGGYPQRPADGGTCALAEDTDWETVGLSTNPEFIQMLERSREQLKRRRGASLADVKKEFGIP